MKTLKILILLSGVFALFTASSVFAEEPAAKIEEPAAKITEVKGNVLVRIAPSTEWTEAKAGQALNQNDSVKTDIGAFALMVFKDKSTVTLKPGTQVALEELVIDDTARKIGINMTIGELKAIVTKVNTPSKFEVKTPTAISGARATTFYVVFDGTDTTIYVEDGSVDFASIISSGEYTVVQGYSSTVLADGTVLVPAVLTPEQKEKVLAGWTAAPVAEPYTEPPAPPADTTEAPDSTKEKPASQT